MNEESERDEFLRYCAREKVITLRDAQTSAPQRIGPDDPRTHIAEADDDRRTVAGIVFFTGAS